jgi:hypothetical protein
MKIMTCKVQKYLNKIILKTMTNRKQFRQMGQTLVMLKENFSMKSNTIYYLKKITKSELSNEE